MFALNISQNGKDFKSYFQNHRLRRYVDLQRALNASKQLFNNSKNNIHTIIIYKVLDNSEVAFLVKEKEEIKVTYTKKEETNDVSVTRKGNIVSIESLVKKPEDLSSKEDRIAFLKECHKAHIEKKKKEGKKLYTADKSVNNLSLKEDSKKSNTFVSSFNAKAIEIAISMKDYKTLFSIEVSLSQKGYSWYPDENNEIKVVPTKQVLDMLNKKK